MKLSPESTAGIVCQLKREHREWGFNHAYAEAVRGGNERLDKDIWLLGTTPQPGDPQRNIRHRDRDPHHIAPDRDGPPLPDRGHRHRDRDRGDPRPRDRHRQEHHSGSRPRSRARMRSRSRSWSRSIRPQSRRRSSRSRPRTRL